jgi:Fic family protein
MKIPETAPDFKNIFAKAGYSELFAKTGDVIKKANNEYLYWDDFKYQPMPEGVTAEEAWAMLKLSRLTQMKNISLTDSKGRSFSYWMPDCVLREIHFIDQQAGGTMLVSDPSVHSDNKRYMVRSLIEEAISSSQIEGAATTRVVAKEMLRTGRQPKDRSERMIYNNHVSMQMIKKRLEEPLSPGLIQEIHALMTKDTLDDPSWVGRFRISTDEDIHIIDKDGRTILHTPPNASGIADLMQALCNYANSDGEDEFVNPLIKGILLHFWLAYVHPFMDGNGRTARALFYWYMLKHNYRLFEFLSISTTILHARTQYYKTFLYSETDDNDATYFIAYNLKAIHAAIEKLNEYIERKQREKKRVSQLAAKYHGLNLRQRALLASAMEKPEEQFTIDTHSRIHGTTYQTARTDLLGLKALGLLEMRKDGKKFIFLPAPDLADKMEGK